MAIIWSAEHLHVQTLAITIAMAIMPMFEPANVWPIYLNIGTSNIGPT